MADGPHTDRQGHQHFDTEAFPAFQPLLVAIEGYAHLTGSRFRSSSFDGFESDASPRSGHCLMSNEKVRAAPQVRQFTERVNQNEPELLQELQTAHSVLMAETVRNAMVSTCKRLELWPPSPYQLPREVLVAPKVLLKGATACNSRSSQELPSFPSLAQRLYEEEEVRGAQRRVARTAAFLVEFMSELEVPRPAIESSLVSRLEKFTSRALSWEQEQQQQLRQQAFEMRHREALASYVIFGALTTASQFVSMSGCARQKPVQVR